MAKHIVGVTVPVNATLGRFSTTALLPLGYRVKDQDGSEYIYVGASGVAAGVPVKRGSSGLSNCVAGTAAADVVGVAYATFPSTSFTYGFIGDRGIHATKVPSGTALGVHVVGGNGTTAAAAAPSGLSAAAAPSKHGITMAAAADAGTAIDVYWF